MKMLPFAVITSYPLISAFFTPFWWRQPDYRADWPALSGRGATPFCSCVYKQVTSKGKHPKKAPIKVYVSCLFVEGPQGLYRIGKAETNSSRWIPNTVASATG